MLFDRVVRDRALLSSSGEPYPTCGFPKTHLILEGRAHCAAFFLLLRSIPKIAAVSFINFVWLP